MTAGRERLIYDVCRLRRRGEAIRAISRALRVDRKTVRGILAEVDRRKEEGDEAVPGASNPRAPKASKLDGFADFIRQTLEKYPDIRATRLCEDLKAQGFTGSYTIVREALRKARPKPKKKQYLEVVTAPGQQAQADWSPYELASGVIAHAFSCVLGHSRHQYLRFCADETQPTVFRQLRNAFEGWEGVPTEIVFDNMKTIVDRWEHGEPILNLKALDFASYYGFEIHLAPRSCGEYKGKVERPFHFLETSFFNGRTFETVKDANAFLRHWLPDRANARLHSTLKRRPVDLLPEDQAALRPLPICPYDDRDLAYRLVDPYGRVHFDGNFYSAGDHVGEWTCVRANEEVVQVYDMRAHLLGTHGRIASGERKTSHLPEHVPAKGRVRIDKLLERFGSWGETAGRFAREVRSRASYPGVQLAEILALQQDYPIEDILAAMEHAAKYGAYDARSVARLLQARAKPRTLKDHLAKRNVEAIERMLRTTVKQRSADDYGRLLAPSAVEKEPKHGKEEAHP